MKHRLNELVGRKTTRRLVRAVEELCEEVHDKVRENGFRTFPVKCDKTNEPFKLMAIGLLCQSGIFRIVSERVIEEGDHVLDVDVTPRGAQRVLRISERIAAKKQFIPQQVA